jgi:GT2 family glycosyltransferase
MTQPSVAIVVVNWNGRDLLPDCLNAALAQDYTGSVEVLVIDNCSTDDSLELLANRFSAVRVLRNDRNNYAAANNLGVRTAQTDYVLLLNNDATVDPGCVRTLVEALERDPNTVGATPKVVFPDGRLYTTGITETKDLYWFDRDHGDADEDQRARGEVPGISGCCALFRREVWIAAGGQDEDFHMYYEDVEFSLRVRKMGFRLLYVPEARVTHIGHASIAKATADREELGERNRLMVLASHYPDRFASLAAASPWFRYAPKQEVLELLPKLARRLGVRESEMVLDLMRSRRGHRMVAGQRRWSLRRRLRKIWNGVRKRLPGPGRA